MMRWVLKTKSCQICDFTFETLNRKMRVEPQVVIAYSPGKWVQLFCIQPLGIQSTIAQLINEKVNSQ